MIHEKNTRHENLYIKLIKNIALPLEYDLHKIKMFSDNMDKAKSRMKKNHGLTSTRCILIGSNSGRLTISQNVNNFKYLLGRISSTMSKQKAKIVT